MTIKWYVTNGVEVKSFDTRGEAMWFCRKNKDWWEVMA